MVRKGLALEGVPGFFEKTGRWGFLKNASKTAHLRGIILPRVIAAVLERVMKEAESLLGLPGEAIFREGLKTVFRTAAHLSATRFRILFCSFVGINRTVFVHFISRS